MRDLDDGEDLMRDRAFAQFDAMGPDQVDLSISAGDFEGPLLSFAVEWLARFKKNARLLNEKFAEELARAAAASADAADRSALAAERSALATESQAKTAKTALIIASVAAITAIIALAVSMYQFFRV